MTAHRWFSVFGSRGSQALDGAAAKHRKGKRQANGRRSPRLRTTFLEQLEDRNLLSITLNSSHLQLMIDTSGDANPGYVTALSDPATNTSYLSAAAPFATVKVGGTQYNCNSCTYANNVLTFGFPSGAGGTSLAVGVQAKTDYFVFTVNSLSPLPTNVSLLNATTPLTNGAGASGVASAGVNSNSFAMFIRTLNPAYNTTVDTFSASCTASNHMVGTAFAVGGSLYGANGSSVVSTLQNLIHTELPSIKSTVGGPWAQQAPINYESYMFANANSSNVADYIAMAKEAHIGMILLSGWFTSPGHYTIQYANGLSDLESIVTQIHNAGLQVGLHTLTDCITSDDSYVSDPVTHNPIRGWPRICRSRWPSAIGASDTTISVNQAIPTTLPTAWGTAGGNVLQIGNELIQYTGYTNNGSTHYLHRLHPRRIRHHGGRAILPDDRFSRFQFRGIFLRRSRFNIAGGDHRNFGEHHQHLRNRHGLHGWRGHTDSHARWPRAVRGVLDESPSLSKHQPHGAIRVVGVGCLFMAVLVQLGRYRLSILGRQDVY